MTVVAISSSRPSPADPSEISLRSPAPRRVLSCHLRQWVEHRGGRGLLASRELAGAGWRGSMMKDYEPILSFGDIDAETYDDTSAGTKRRRSRSWNGWRGVDRRWSWRSAPGGSRCRWRRGESASRASTSRPRWSQAAPQAGGDQIAVTMGDFADVPVRATYRLIYVVYNTLFNLLTQDDQVRCFENVAAHLTDDGVFVVEAFVPAYLTRLRDDQYVDAERSASTRCGSTSAATTRSRNGSTRATWALPRGLRLTDRHPLRMAERARPDGPHRGLRLKRALGRLGTGALHRHQPDARLRLRALNKGPRPNRAAWSSRASSAPTAGQKGAGVSNRGSVLFSARTTRDCDVEALAPPGTPIERNRGRTGHGDGEGVMQWVTRARPKVDRIDCP